MSTILKAYNISKQYRLGTIGTGTLGDDLKRWWYQVRGKEDPFLKVGAVNDRSSVANEDYVWALRDINFEVKQGEVLGIIGKNGAGKSTLLKLLSRVTSPTTGSIRTKGRIASLLEIGTGFHPELTGRENIFMNGAVLGMTRREIKNKLEEIIAFSGCEKYIDTPVKRYSSGMTVRLGFAVAAHLEPEILVVDEVLAVGDAEFQKKAIGKMQDLSTGEGRTVLFVSHNMASIRSLCTRIILLEKGRVAYEGETENGINYYLMKDTEKMELKPSRRKDRIGNGKLAVKDVFFLNEAKKEVKSIISGETLEIVVVVTENQPLDYNKLIISVAFQDNYQNTVLLFSSDEMDCNFTELAIKHEVSLIVPSLLLRGGDYNIRIVMTEGPARRENFLDALDNVISLHVFPGDLYNINKQNRSLNQVILPGYYEV